MRKSFSKFTKGWQEKLLFLKKTMIQAGKAYLSRVPVEVEVMGCGHLAEK
jgi:hypothetical protein